MAKCKEEIRLKVTCSERERIAVLDVTGEYHCPLELTIEQWFSDFNDYAREYGPLWLAASGVTEVIRGRMLIMGDEPESVRFK